jgi:RNA polymerase sigma-70 factor, ECF subfamily
MTMLVIDAMKCPREAVPTRIDADARLLEALRRRDPSAAERLVARFGDRAYRLAMGITRNPPDAEEAVQDAFWSVIRKIDLFRGDSAFGSWLYRIVTNAAYQKLRGRVRLRTEVSLDEVLPSFTDDGRHAAPVTDWSASSDDPSRQAELRIALSAAMDELRPEYNAAVVLRDVAGLSMAEVAESLGISVPNAKARVHRARLFLRARLAAYMSTAPIVSRESVGENE